MREREGPCRRAGPCLSGFAPAERNKQEQPRRTPTPQRREPRTPAPERRPAARTALSPLCRRRCRRRRPCASFKHPGYRPPRFAFQKRAETVLRGAIPPNSPSSKPSGSKCCQHTGSWVSLFGDAMLFDALKANAEGVSAAGRVRAAAPRYGAARALRSILRHRRSRVRVAETRAA